ncbi:MAG TPA: T9SS type A sorting domain-containing protein [Chitinophagaceae bacterium]|nr:T9SS type A sorting domain-containing protein [Chitinophagaceae bacterium]
MVKKKWHIEIPDQGPSAGPLGEIISSFEFDNNNNICFVGRGINISILVFRYYRGKIMSNGTLDYLMFNNFPGIITFGSGADQLLWHANDEAYILLSDQLSRIEKLDPSSGAISWTKQITHDSAQVATFSIQEFQQSFYAFSNLRYQILDTTFQGFHYTPYQFMVTKFGKNAATLWEKILDITGDTLYNDFRVTQVSFCDTSMYVSATRTDPNAITGPYVLMAKLDTLANVQWYDTTSTDIATVGSFGMDDDCHAYMGIGLNATYAVHKFADSVIVVPNSVRYVNDMQVLAYPNPLNDQLFLTHLPAHVTLTLWNLQGELLLTQTCHDETLTLNMQAYPSGLYMVRLQSAKSTQYLKLSKQ